MKIVEHRTIDRTGGQINLVTDGGGLYKAVLVNYSTNFSEDMCEWTSKEQAMQTMVEVQEANVDALKTY